MSKALTTSVLLFLLPIFLVHSQTTTNLGTNSGDQGNNNTFVGFRAGQNNTNNSNSFYGTNAGRFHLDGRNNVFLGVNAGADNPSGLNNNFIGVSSGRRTTGNNNSFLGHSSGVNMVAGVRNVFLGAVSGRTIASGNGNIFIGFGAGPESTDNTVALNNTLFLDNRTTNKPLIYGKFNTDQLGVNVESIPQGITFAVGGSALIDGALTTNGKISIGTTISDPDYELTVKGKIHVQEVKVDLQGAIVPDYVFNEDYYLNTLEEVEDYISQEGHLPNIPSAKEMKENGINLKEMNLKLLEKIEELTLYMLDQSKALQKEKSNTAELEKRLIKLESLLQVD